VVLGRERRPAQARRLKRGARPSSQGGEGAQDANRSARNGASGGTGMQEG